MAKRESPRRGIRSVTLLGARSIKIPSELRRKIAEYLSCADAEVADAIFQYIKIKLAWLAAESRREAEELRPNQQLVALNEVRAAAELLARAFTPCGNTNLDDQTWDLLVDSGFSHIGTEQVLKAVEIPNSNLSNFDRIDSHSLFLLSNLLVMAADRASTNIREQLETVSGRRKLHARRKEHARDETICHLCMVYDLLQPRNGNRLRFVFECLKLSGVLAMSEQSLRNRMPGRKLDVLRDQRQLIHALPPRVLFPGSGLPGITEYLPKID